MHNSLKAKVTIKCEMLPKGDVLVNKEKNSCLNKRLFKKKKPKIKNQFIKKKCIIKRENSINNALNECLIAIGDLDDGYSYDKLLNDEIATCSTTEIHSNLHTLKKEELLSVVRESNSNFDKDRVHTINKKTQQLQTIKKIEKSESKYSQVEVRNIFINPSSTEQESKNNTKQFLQQGSCFALPSNIKKCIECHIHHMKKHGTESDYNNNACRFYAFRLLRYNKSGKLLVVGYPDPYKNLKSIDLIKWIPNERSGTPGKLNVQTSIKILEDTGGFFCNIVHDENKALNLINEHKKKRKILWKQSVNGRNDICDVCKTSIFNYHWTCSKCGFVVCVDCYRSKNNGSKLVTIRSSTEEQDNKKWLLCSNQKVHNVNQLTITQILVGDVLNHNSELMHNTCSMNNIHINCNCIPSHVSHVSNDSITDTFLGNMFGNFTSDNITETTSYFLSFLSNEDSNALTIKSEKMKSENKDHTKKGFSPKLLLMIDNKSNIPHMRLCNGLLLRLLDPINDKNFELFQEEWKRGQPVLVSNVGKNLSPELWHPKSFSRDFGDQKCDIINSTINKVLNDYPICKFLDGFENTAKRLCDTQGNAMFLKLKDWPPSSDFADILPDRFQDLINCLPLKEYTHRNGRFNLVSHLPEYFVQPDLGPKMYISYSNAGSQFEKIGTINLHLERSDAVNVLVYVASTKNLIKEYDYNWYTKEALKVIEDADCDDLTMRRINVDGEIPGVLWHIYHSSDATAIRSLLTKVANEHGTILEDCNDLIHDQSYYLDNNLRYRLFREYGIKGYTVVQFYGDAVFIPAGAPHQARNLHNCINVASNFVSPENIYPTFCMSQEFRNLCDSNTNHEDKLQIKNIIFHAIKDSISVLMSNQKNNV